MKYCYDCHGNGNHKGDVALDKYPTTADVVKNHTVWETVMQRINTQEMPPPDAGNFPDRAERDRITDWIAGTLYNYDPAHPDPGRVTVHRLNRNEYNNTIRDLVGVDFQPADDFPADNSGYGFDNVSDVLSLSPTLMEDYLSAAGKIMDQAIATDPIPSEKQHFAANLMQFGFNADGDSGDGWMPLSALEEDEVAVILPISGGDYTVRVQAYNKSRGAGGGRGRGAPATAASTNAPATAALAPAPAAAPAAAGKPILLTCMIDYTIVHVWAVTATSKDQPGVYEARISIPPGKHRLSVVNHRIRGGANELQMSNGRIGQCSNETEPSWSSGWNSKARCRIKSLFIPQKISRSRATENSTRKASASWNTTAKSPPSSTCRKKAIIFCAPKPTRNRPEQKPPKWNSALTASRAILRRACAGHADSHRRTARFFHAAARSAAAGL